MNKQNNEDVRPLPEVEIPGTLGKLIRRISRIRPIWWLAATIPMLTVFSIFLPQSIWVMLWKGLRAQSFLVGMSACFSLLAISLVWATGQRIDVWVFTFINERGHRPAWLDWIMLGFTQIGNGAFAYTVAFVLFLRVKHLLAYELIFGNLTLWLMVELMKVLIRRTRPYARLTDARVIGDKARGDFFSKRAHQPGLFYGLSDIPLFPDWFLRRSADVYRRSADVYRRPASGRHAHVCRHALPEGLCSAALF